MSNTTASSGLNNIITTGLGSSITSTPYIYYPYTYTPAVNFYDFQVRKAKNGFILNRTFTNKASSEEYVFENIESLLKFIKEEYNPA